MIIKFCKGHKGEFEVDDDYPYAVCEKCRARSALNSKKKKKNKILCSFQKDEYKCKQGVKKGEKYCGKHIEIVQRLENEKLGIFLCASRFSCKEKVSGFGVKCEKCLARLRDYDKKRRENAKESNDDHEGEKLCSKKPHWKPIADFINEKGIECKQCKDCREAQKKQDEKRKDRKRNWTEELNKNPERKANKEQWKKDNYDKVASYWLKYRSRKYSEDPEGYKAHLANRIKIWRQANPDKVKAINDKHYNNPYNKLNDCKYTAEIKNIKWNLDDEYAIGLLLDDCYYCGDAIDENHLNGIDRLDSNLDYTIDNVCSCCKMCNFMKNSIHWIVFIKRCHHIAAYNLLVPSYLFPEMFADYGLRSYYNKYKKRAEEKKIQFDISIKKFNKIRLFDCYICGKKSIGNNLNGIDRIDNAEGYINNNIKSCCGNCNYMKRNYTLNKFLKKCKVISELHLDTRGLFDHKKFNVIDIKVGQKTRDKKYIPGTKLKILREKEDIERNNNYSDENIKNWAKKIADNKNKSLYDDYN
jgi:hypothetical protein